MFGLADQGEWLHAAFMNAWQRLIFNSWNGNSKSEHSAHITCDTFVGVNVSPSAGMTVELAASTYRRLASLGEAQ